MVRPGNVHIPQEGRVMDPLVIAGLLKLGKVLLIPLAAMYLVVAIGAIANRRKP